MQAWRSRARSEAEPSEAWAPGKPDAEEGVAVDPHAADHEAAAHEVARLEALGGARPGAPVFPALAEAHRRAGDAEKAVRVAREGLAERPDVPAGRVPLGRHLVREVLAKALEVGRGVRGGHAAAEGGGRVGLRLHAQNLAFRLNTAVSGWPK